VNHGRIWADYFRAYDADELSVGRTISSDDGNGRRVAAQDKEVDEELHDGEIEGLHSHVSSRPDRRQAAVVNVMGEGNKGPAKQINTSWHVKMETLHEPCG
jgi:hypothetical protein